MIKPPVSMMLSIAFGLIFGVADLRAQPGGGNQGIQESDAKTIKETESKFFANRNNEDAGSYTSHFNFDNRKSPPNPTTTNKYWCEVECLIRRSDGTTVRRYYTHSDVSTVKVGEYDDIDINEKKVHVIACRFWWKLKPRILADWHGSEWVRAKDGEYIVYAFLEWQGSNGYIKPIYFYAEPLQVETDATK